MIEQLRELKLEEISGSLDVWDWWAWLMEQRPKE